MITAKRTISATLAGLLCSFVMGCGSGAAPEAGVLDPGGRRHPGDALRLTRPEDFWRVPRLGRHGGVARGGDKRACRHLRLDGNERVAGHAWNLPRFHH